MTNPYTEPAPYEVGQRVVRVEPTPTGPHAHMRSVRNTDRTGLQEWEITDNHGAVYTVRRDGFGRDATDSEITQLTDEWAQSLQEHGDGFALIREDRYRELPSLDQELGEQTLDQELGGGRDGIS